MPSPLPSPRRTVRQLLLASLLAPTLLASGAAFATAPTGRYQVIGETVLDRATGLVWQRSAAEGTFGWAAAKSHCAALEGGTAGWRLPSVRELSTLVDPDAPPPTIDTTAFPSTPSARFWTATAYAPAAGSAWTVVFNDGGVLHAGATESHSVRCVR